MRVPEGLQALPHLFAHRLHLARGRGATRVLMRLLHGLPEVGAGGSVDRTKIGLRRILVEAIVCETVAGGPDDLFRAHHQCLAVHDAVAFAEAVHDDGTHGDERRGDGAYSTTIDVPADVPTIIYRFHRDGEPEFKPLPPLSSSMADRLLAVPRDTVGPVDVFGESLFMAERAYPNAEGQALVAALVAERIKALPSFRRFVAGPGDAGGRRADGPPGS